MAKQEDAKLTAQEIALLVSAAVAGAVPVGVVDKTTSTKVGESLTCISRINYEAAVCKAGHTDDSDRITSEITSLLAE